MLSESEYLTDFLVGLLGKKPQTLSIPIYSTTVLYDIYTHTHNGIACVLVAVFSQTPHHTIDCMPCKLL